MSDWYALGVALRVPPSKLKEIRQSAPQEGIQYWRIELLQYWLDSTPDASWSMIIAALEKIGHHTLSARLRDNYIIPVAGADRFVSIGDYVIVYRSARLL